MKYTNQTFTNQEIILDGNQFEGCTFDNCNFVFSGGVTEINGCNIDPFNLTFAGAASSTLGFMREIYKGGELEKELIERTFANIRNSVVSEDDILDAGFIN